MSTLSKTQHHILGVFHLLIVKKSILCGLSCCFLRKNGCEKRWRRENSFDCCISGGIKETPALKFAFFGAAKTKTTIRWYYNMCIKQHICIYLYHQKLPMERNVLFLFAKRTCLVACDHSTCDAVLIECHRKVVYFRCFQKLSGLSNRSPQFEHWLLKKTVRI